MHVQLLVNVVGVGLDGVRRDDQLFRDVVLVSPARQHRVYPRLLVGQLVRLRNLGARRLPLVQERVRLRLAGLLLAAFHEVPHQQHDQGDHDDDGEDGVPGVKPRLSQPGVQQRPDRPPDEDTREVADGGRCVGCVHRQLAVAYLVGQIAPGDGIVAGEPEDDQC